MTRWPRLVAGVLVLVLTGAPVFALTCAASCAPASTTLHERHGNAVAPPEAHDHAAGVPGSDHRHEAAGIREASTAQGAQLTRTCSDCCVGMAAVVSSEVATRADATTLTGARLTARSALPVQLSVPVAFHVESSITPPLLAVVPLVLRI